MLAREIRTHYKRPEIVEAITRISTFGNCSRSGMKFIPRAYTDRETGEIRDAMDWYNLRPGSRKVKKKINLSSMKHYFNAVTECRTLYWTLNVFENEIYDIDYRQVDRVDGPMLSRSYTVGYTLGIDIDKERGCDIHDPDVKRAVEDMAQFFTDQLRVYLPDSVYVLYSGGGIYIMLHHGAFEKYFDRFRYSDDWDMMLLTFLDAFDCLIGDMREAFFKAFPHHVGKVKPDQLNGSQRVFKTIYSVHKTLDYAVVPLDPDDIKINFDDATLPLSDSVIARGKSWYTRWDDGTEFLNNVLKPYLENSYKNRRSVISRVDGGEVAISEIPIGYEKWAPCMKNLFELGSCGEGATRALAVFCSYLGQIGIPEDEAFEWFNMLASRWNARTSNLFESYYRNMKVPTCERLNALDNVGFPRGVSLRNLCVCAPDDRCRKVPSPLYYSDADAEKKRMESKADRVIEYKPVINIVK